MKSAAIVCFIALTGAVAACGSSDSSSGGSAVDKQDMSLAMFAYAYDDPWGVAQAESAEETAKEAGVDLKVFDAAGDAGKQFNQVQDAVASGQFDGFVVSAVDGAGISAAIEDAAAQDIQTVCIGAPCGPDGNGLKPQVDGEIAYVGVTGKVDGEVQGDLVKQFCKDKDPCQVAYIPGFASSPVDGARLDAFKSTVGEDKNIDVVATAEGGYDQRQAFQVTQDMLQANPDIDLIAAADDGMALGVEQAANEAGKDVAIIGNAASKEGVKRVAAGEWLGTSVWLPRSEAREGTNILIDSLSGKTDFPTAVDIRKKSTVGPVVTQENAADFQSEWGN